MEVVAIYNLRLLDINRKRIAIIDVLQSWRYTRRPSEATDITLTIPREDVEAALPAGTDIYAFLSPSQVVPVGGDVYDDADMTHERAQIAHYIEIYRGADHVVTGRISKRDVSDNTVTITCHTEEIVAESHVTPAQYGRKWDNWDLADVTRDALNGWHTMRVKDRTQWQAAIEAVNVDMDTEPGVVMLAKDSGGQYRSSGRVTLRFNRADVPDFVSWDRIRWASDNGAPVRTTMQYRADGGAWSQAVEGALPDEIGVVPGTVDADVIDVRINLYTEDTEAEDGDGNKVGITPYVFAVEVIARTEGTLQAGDIPPSAGVLVSGIDADGASALNVLSEACGQAGWEFWVADGRLNLAEKMGEDRTDSVLLRSGTNMTVQTLTDGDDELVNVLTAYGPGDGINRLQVTRRHEESIATYGEYRGKQEFDGASTLADLIEAADEYLDEHAAPTPAFRADVHYPYGTEPEYGVGDYVRVADPRNGIITRSRIAEEQRRWSEAGLRTTLYLGLPAPSLARQVRPSPPPPEIQPPDKPVITVTSIPGGIRVIDTRVPNIRWARSECYVSTTRGFVPSSESLVDHGRRSRFDVGGLTPGTRYYVRLVRVDTHGSPSDPSDEMSAVAGWFGEQQVDPELFSIKPTSEPEPLTGKLEHLWDMDPATGCTFESAPTITYKYPVDQGSDMVRVHISGNAMGYVQMRAEEGHWIDVAGNASEPIAFTDGWNVRRFDGNRLYFGREYRIVFLQNVVVNEIKFWRVTLADEILAQVVTLTDELRIANEDRSLEITDRGLRVESTDGATIVGANGVVFERPDGVRSGYVRGVQAGVAEDGEDVALNFINEPTIILTPADAAVYDPDKGGLQKLKLEATNASPEGFTVSAKLVKHAGAEDREVFERTETYLVPTTGQGALRACTSSGHGDSGLARWSPHRLLSVGDTQTFQTEPGATRVTLRIREMMHAHANAGNMTRVNRITYRIRIREVGSTTWLETLGPYTRSRTARSSLFNTSFSWSHNANNYVFDDLVPAQYEVQVEITSKTVAAGSGNSNLSCYLIVEEFIQAQEQIIKTPEPMVVHYVALESDGAGGDEDDD